MTTPATLTINGVECAIPMDSPYFHVCSISGKPCFRIYIDKYSSKFIFITDILEQPSLSYYVPIIAAVAHLYYVPIIAAVAHLYWTQKASDLMEDDDGADEWQLAVEHADAWALVAKGGTHV